MWSFFSLGCSTGLSFVDCWIQPDGSWMFIPTPAVPPTRNNVKACLSYGTSRQCLSWVTLQLERFTQGDVSGSGSQFVSCGFLVSHLVFSGSNQPVLLGRFYCLIICAQLQNLREQICFFCLPFSLGESTVSYSHATRPHVLPTYIHLSPQWRLSSPPIQLAILLSAVLSVWPLWLHLPNI